MSWHSLPLFVRLAGRPVILLGKGEAADAKRRLLERAGAVVSDEDAEAVLAIVAIDDEQDARAAIDRLRARHILVNAVDRPDWCDFTLPAIVDRDPVLIAIGTGGASAGLAAALRQRLEALLPATLGGLATALFTGRPTIRRRYPDSGDRRRALGGAFAEGGALDPFRAGEGAVDAWIGASNDASRSELVEIALTSPDADDLTLRQARVLALADRVYHRADVPATILDRARADAARIECNAAPVDPGKGLSVDLTLAG
ncbi:siroheme synthase [Sphingomonas sp. So64.6b]|uniref:precorrin-2 dehydrogenase/sirohydrochlorin ferrochelatase family protein n=1 Tax=Sphingomonas sp. So64.6b TaxID=2997354 RepID=UPI001600054A|nr:NAD(P)-dependent oxidoreductase [Sphingomonas sp. So64.6b]QNA85759.1 siroheme synthase [Sphingomonas sp. So64.6b]